MLSDYKVFISYHHEYDTLAQKLYDSFCAADIRSFLDEKSIAPGLDIVEEVRKGLTQCDSLVCLVSKGWIDSIFCRREINSIIMDGKKRIYPLLIEPDLTLPYDLQSVKAIEFSDWKTNYQIRISELLHAMPYGPDFFQLQKSTLLNSAVLPWIPMNEISFDYIWPELFVNTNIVLLKHISKTTIKDWVAQYSFHDDVMIIGDPGAGKSSLLKYICLANYESFNVVFFTAKELLEAWQTSHFINEMLAYIYHNESIIIDMAKIHGIIIDGIDEVNSEKINDIEEILQYFRQHNIHILASSRSEFYYRHFNTNRVRSSFFFELIRVEEWSVEQGKEYVNLYSRKAKDNSINLRIQNLIQSNEKACLMIRNPFRASLLLYLFCDGLYSPSIDLANVYALYDEFYKNWIVQEHKRKTSKLPKNFIISFHEAIAIKMYILREGIYVNDYTLKELAADNHQVSDIISDTGIMGLLLTDARHDSVYVEKFQHETLLEYLIAKQLVDAFVSDSSELQYLLKTVYSNNVNIFVRAYFELLPEKKRRMAAIHLSHLYEVLFFTPSVHESPVNEQIREQIIYYVGRIPLSYTPQVLEFAYHHENNSILRRSAALSLILEGNEEVEAEYLNMVLDNPDYDIENRSIQLVYFGDVDDDFHTYRDIYSSSWERTKSVLIGRFKHNSNRDRRLRLWDIITFKSFIISRGISTLSQEDIESIIACKIIFEEDSAARKDFLAREKRKLIQMLGQ